MPLFGETGNEYADRRADMDDDVWIKGFQVGDTRFRPLEPTKTWKTVCQHYKKEAGGGFPCGQREKEPIFCPVEAGEESDAKVKDRPRRYIFNGLDEKGRLNLYQVGIKLFKDFQQQEAKGRNITEFDFTITREGSGLDTKYYLDRGEKYPIEEIPELHNAAEILGQKYVTALKHYGFDEDGKFLDDTPPAKEEKGSGNALHDSMSQKPAAKDEEDTPPWEKEEAAAKPARIGAKSEPDEAQSTSTEKAGNFDPADPDHDLETLDAPQLRAWLDYREVEYPKSEPRPRLLKRAFEWSPV